MSGFDLTGRVAIVTGASRGLGQTFARALARAGADLVITSRTAASLKPFQGEVESLGRRVVPLELDVRSEESIRAMAAEAAKAYPRIDILVNNAGCNVRKPAADVTWQDWNLILDTNLRGAFFVAQAVAQLMIPHRRGSHHQHRFAHVGGRLRRPRSVRREPRRHPAVDDEPGGGLGAARHHGELSGAGVVQDRSEQGDVRRPGLGGIAGRSHSSRASRDGRAISKGRSCSWRRTPANTSPVRRCSSTAACRRAPSVRCRADATASRDVTADPKAAAGRTPERPAPIPARPGPAPCR